MLTVLMPSLNKLVSYDYESIKNKESEAIIAQSLKGLIPVKNPELLQVSGIPGAGKSTYCAKHMLSNYLYLSFDNIMTKLEGYKKELALNGNEKAFKKYEMVARVIGYELLNRALSLNINIMLEHSGTNNAHLELFKNVKNKGYKTSIDFIVCDTDLAIKRAKERSIKINRHVPESLIIERASAYKEYINEYKKITSNINVLDGANDFAILKKI